MIPPLGGHGGVGAAIHHNDSPMSGHAAVMITRACSCLKQTVITAASGGLRQVVG